MENVNVVNRKMKRNTKILTIAGKCILFSVICCLCIAPYATLDGGTEGDGSIVTILMRGKQTLPADDQREGGRAPGEDTAAANKILLVNVAQRVDAAQLLATIVNAEQANDDRSTLALQGALELMEDEPERRARATNASVPAPQSGGKQHPEGGYYEEQRPMLVHSESKPPVMGYRQAAYAAPPSDTVALRGDAGAAARSTEESYYDRDDDYEEPAYDDDDALSWAEPHAAEEGGSKSALELDAGQRGRASAQLGQEQRTYDDYYRQWQQYATTTAPGPAAAGGNRQLQQPPQGNREPYPAFADTDRSDYDYPYSLPVRQQQQTAQQQQKRLQLQRQQQEQQQQQQMYRQQQQQQQRQQQRPQQRVQEEPQQENKQQLQKKQAASTATPTPTTGSPQSSMLSVVQSLKTMWDIYQAFSSAWNALAEHRQRQEHALQQQLKFKQQQQQQQLKQGERPQKTRINSKRPPQFASTDGDKYASRNATTTNAKSTSNRERNATSSSSTTANVNGAGKITAKTTTKTPTTRGRTTTVKKPPARTTKGTTERPSADEQPIVAERRKREATAKGDAEPLAAAPSASTAPAASTAIAEGRYIKGDPLKGYYDFVITEGSYKFWAVFQVGTALLIIYSTFAAIYYSKVNPLVSDYDYTDYLGGARSLSGVDLDFIDDDDATDTATATQSLKQLQQQQQQQQQGQDSWLGVWMPHAGNSLQFILDAIDKLPVDHDHATAAATAAYGNKEKHKDDGGGGGAKANDQEPPPNEPATDG